MKVGDKVLIVNNLKELYNGEDDFIYDIVDDMLEFSGKEAIIISSNWYGGYKLDIDEGKWDWKNVLLKPIEK